MSCTRGCAGTPICSALDLCCIQFRQDCGKGCAGVADGYSVIQIAADGSLEVCSNVGGICTCVGFGTNSTVTQPGDGTAIHDDGSGSIEILDICALLVEAYTLSTWTTLTLSAGWVAEAGMQTPEYRCLCDGTVQLRGCMSHDDADLDNAVPTAIGTLPAADGLGNACRPPSGVRYQGGANCATIEIDTAGALTTNPSITPSTRCLDGIEFYV